LFRNRQDACSTIKLILCGTGILPVLDNGARYQLTFYAFKDIDSNTPGVRNRQDACSTIKLILCGTGILPVLDNGARYQLTFYAFKDIDSNTPGFR
jgi:hypothetical protein